MVRLGVMVMIAVVLTVMALVLFATIMEPAWFVVMLLAAGVTAWLLLRPRP
jgi:hypothetical protein